MSNKNGRKWIRDEKRIAIYLRDGGKCLWCDSKQNLTLDHFSPRSIKSSNHQTNLFTACHGCNSRRQDRSVREFAEKIGKQQKIAEINKVRRRKIDTRASKALILQVGYKVATGAEK